jgi:hypothetical protein
LTTFFPLRHSIAADGGLDTTGRERRQGPTVDTFPHLTEHADRLRQCSLPLDADQTVELLCSDCPFYHPDREEQLECGSFRILRRLLERGTITPAQIVAACR